MAGTPSKKRKRPGPSKQPPRGNPQKVRDAGRPRPVQKATPRDWIGAARLRTLPLAITPILIGTGAAMIVDGLLHWVIALFCLFLGLALAGICLLARRQARREGAGRSGAAAEEAARHEVPLSV